MNIKLIIGIGNKNKNLQKTRHNIGIWFIKKLLKKNIKLNKIYKLYIKKKIIYIYTPKSYINKSGKNIKKIKKKLKIKTKNILIVYDDINIKPGLCKIEKNNKKNITHNGIKNIIKLKIKKKFYKLRIGIGRPKNKNNLNNYVLSKPTYSEKKLIKNTIKKCTYYIKKLIKNNKLNKIQNILNSKKKNV